MIYESIAQASATASRACIILSKDSLESEAAISQVDETKCKGCGACIEVCPFKAIELRTEEIMVEKVLFQNRKAHINPIVCKGCGSCAVSCPLGAITPQHFTSRQIEASLEATIARIPVPKLLTKT
jgi:heterodisulfide reductase subunit A